MVLQLAPLPSQFDTTNLEERIKDETASLGSLPDISARSLIYSPECNVKLENVTVTGIRTEKYRYKARHFALYLSVLLFGLVLLTTKQIEYSSTQSVW